MSSSGSDPNAAAMVTEDHSDKTEKRKSKPGAAWKATETHVVPDNKLWIVCRGALALQR
jgi:hypothetical protein